MAITDGRLAEVLEGVDELAVGAMNEDATPGMGVGIVGGPEIVSARGLGLADAGGEGSVSRQTVFRIGWISKTMTAVG